MRLILLGPPGAGKGTQATLLCKRFKLKHLSVGDFLRKEYKKKTPLGLAAYTYWSKGILAPDKMILQVVEEHLPKNNYLLDGHPRTIYEAKHLEKLQPTDLVFYLTSSKKVIIKRLLKRALIEGRKDDTLNVIKKRIDVYHTHTEPVLTYYKKKLIKIEGNRTPLQVYKDISKRITTLKNSSKF